LKLACPTYLRRRSRGKLIGAADLAIYCRRINDSGHERVTATAGEFGGGSARQQRNAAEPADRYRGILARILSGLLVLLAPSASRAVITCMSADGPDQIIRLRDPAQTLNSSGWSRRASEIVLWRRLAWRS
jgi:ethanolamine ammonia-lyase large subunit